METTSPEIATMLPDDELAKLGELPEAKRRVALARLRALSVWRSDRGRYRDVQHAAAEAGVSVRRFQALAALGEPMRLVDLGLYLGRRDAGEPRTDDRDALLAVARTALGDDPDLSTSALLERMRRQTGTERSKATLLRIVDDVRRDAPSRRPFGHAIAWDSAWIALSTPDGAALRLHAALDVGTGLVLGHVLAPDGGASAAYGSVAAMVASARPAGLDREALRQLVVDDGPTLFSISLPDDAADMEMETRVVKAGWRLVTASPRRGRAAIAALGRSIGGVAIAAGTPALAGGRPIRLATLTASGEEALAEAVSTHNRARFAIAQKGDGRRAADLLRAASAVVEG